MTEKEESAGGEQDDVSFLRTVGKAAKNKGNGRKSTQVVVWIAALNPGKVGQQSGWHGSWGPQILKNLFSAHCFCINQPVGVLYELFLQKMTRFSLLHSSDAEQLADDELDDLHHQQFLSKAKIGNQFLKNQQNFFKFKNY